MTDYPGILGQASPVSGALTTIYTVTKTYATITSINVCNLTNLQQTFKIATSKGGYVDCTFQYVYSNVPIQGNDTFERTAALMLSTGDQVRAVVSASGAVAIQLYGVETL